MLIEAKWPGDSRLKVICGGEALPWLLATQLRQRSGSLWNMYGPTETTIWSALSIVELSDALVTIGRPIGNTQIYLLDREMQPVASGVAGELYIGGTGLAHGYLNLPALTAEKFVPDPFATQAGSRLYRTGDLARHLDDGRIEFLGRIDQQVKVRGYRIELGEIETVLMRHPAVRSAVVVTREDVAGDKRLVAYLVLEGAPPPSGWRSLMKEALPDYMIPQAYVLLESLPLTPNGKVDRRALPAPEYTGAEAEGSYTAAGNAIEEMIAGIWCEVLRVERVGPLDSFFELGGHSLLAMQVVSRVREALQCEVPVRLLFETPILREFAASIEASRLTEQGLQAPPIQSVSRDVALPLSFAQQRLWLLNQLEPESPAYNIPVAVRLSGELNVAALERTLGEIIKRHEVLRTTFSVKDGTPVQVIGPATPFRLALIDLSTWSEVEREQETLVLAAREAAQPFDLEQGPLLRATLLKLSEHEHVVLFTMHHIVSDGWSMTVLIKEVTILYEAFVRDQPSPLADLNIQYADYSAWQHDHLRGDVLEKHLRYWRKQLAGAPALLELPADHPRPPSQTLHGATQSIILPTRTAEGIKRLSRAEGATLYMTLLAAFQTLLHRWTGQDDIVVGSDIANRSKLETEGLIGCFFNFLTLRTDFSGNPTFRQLLGRVREITLGAYTHQDLPFEMLIEELKPARDPSYSPLFQVLFDFQSAAQQPSPELPGLTLSMLPLPSTVAKFDLSLFVVERAEQLSCTLEYNTDLFDSSTIERLLTSFDTLLDEIVKNPDVAIQKIAMPTEQESRQLIHAFNDDLG
jgi:acyl carrier protein